MPFCPNCKYEYEKNIEYCSDCGAKLVDELEKGPEPVQDEEYDKEAFLINVADDIQASILISKLSAYDIPALKKYKEQGSFMPIYTGNSLFGIDLYVPSKLLSTAKEVLNDNSPVDADSLEFDKMMDEYGFDDIDNLEFENDDNVKENETRDIHLESTASEPEAPSVEPASSFRNSFDDLTEDRKKRDKKVKLIRAAIYVFFIIPLIISLILALINALTYI